MHNLTEDDLLTSEFIFIPIYKHSHWLVSIIKPRSKEIIVCDSKQWYDIEILEFFKKYENVILDEYFGASINGWTFKNISNNVPYQYDGNS